MKIILIAENNKSDLEWYDSVFQKHGYRVLVAPNAEEALKSYKSELEHRSAKAKRDRISSSLRDLPFDAVILNHRALDRDGMHVAKEILSVNSKQRIIFVSASDEYTEELQNEFYGKVDIIQKPFGQDAFVELLESAEIYKALEKLGLDIQKLKEYHLHHFQLLELLAACLALLKAGRGNGK